MTGLALGLAAAASFNLAGLTWTAAGCDSALFWEPLESAITVFIGCLLLLGWLISVIALVVLAAFGYRRGTCGPGCCTDRPTRTVRVGQTVPRWSTPTAIARIFSGGVVLFILVLGFVVDWSDQGHNPFDYFGYFTNLTRLLAATALIITGGFALAGHRLPQSLVLCRAVATSCLIVVAVVYNGLVPGTSTAPAWVSTTLHIAFPVLVLLDWVLIPDHPGLRWSHLWLVLPYPLAWVAVVLVRGATDGWVPYGFLLPETGLSSLTLHVIGLTIVLLLAGAVVWATRRTGVRS